jgi:hypothetical protein
VIGATIPSTPEKDSVCLSELDITNLASVPTSAIEGTYKYGNQLRCLESHDSKIQENSKFSGPMVDRVSSSSRSEDETNLSLSLDVLVDFCTLYGFSAKEYDRKSTLAHWQICSVNCGWMAFLKYKLSAFMSAYLKNDLPPCPFEQLDYPFHIAGGRLGRFISRKIMLSDKALSFTVGLLYLKKGLPRPSFSACEQSKKATKKVLTTKQILPISPYRKKFRNRLRFVVRQTFHKCITDEDLHHPYAPSIKANYVDSRSKFGTFGTLFDLGLIKDVATDDVGPSLAFAHQSSGVYHDCLVVDSSSEEIESEDSVLYRVNPRIRSRVQSVYTDVYEKARLLAMNEVANVKLVSLAESLKVRTISKGPPLTYFVLKPVQKFLHRIMRRIETFSLIGEPVSIEFLNKKFQDHEGQFHSLDYKSATDLLDPEVSSWCVDEICDAVRIPDDIRSLFHKALTGHEIEGVPQLWGQLMGSVVSFIVLCLVNATVCLYSYQECTNTRVGLRNAPIIVNGDDGLVRAPPSFLKIWKEISSCIGLIPSVGKTYSSDSYANINSTSFILSNGKFELIPYVNMGLVEGLGRSSASGVQDVVDNTKYSLSLGARHHDLLNSCPKDMRLAVHELFLRKNAKILKVSPLPWYIPEKLGGIGLQPLVVVTPSEDIDEPIIKSYEKTSTGHKCGPSRRDVMIAYSLIDKIHKSFRVKLVPTLQPIQARAIWQKAFFKNIKDRSIVEVNDSQSGFLDMATYYLTPTRVMVESDLEESMAILRHNERCWSCLSSIMGDLPEGADLFLN